MLTDHDLQNELAAAFGEQADPVTSAGIGITGIFRRAVRRRRRRRVAAGAASLMAIAAVAVSVPVASRIARPALSSPPGGPPGFLLEAAMTGALPAQAALSGMPPYYVTASHSSPAAEIRDSASGKILGTVALPQGIDPKMSKITVAGNDRTFVLALSFPQTRFYLLRVAAGGRSARLAALNISPLPAGEYVNSIAVSGDGSTLAVAIQDSGAHHGAVQAVSLTTGATRTWATSRTGMPWALSWAGHELGFFWQDDAASSKATASGLWVLDTTAPGRNLMSGHRIVPEFTGSDDVQSAILAPDGNSVIASVTYAGTGHVTKGTIIGGIVELSARTGHPLHTLLVEHAAHSADPGHAGWAIVPCALAAADTTGNHVLASCDSFGRLDHGNFTTLPGAAPHTAITAAW